MAVLGVPYRIVYKAKNRATGLGSINVMVLKPNLSQLGAIPMVEFAPAWAKGLYYCDLITAVDDPEGKWLYSIFSAQESWIVDCSVEMIRDPSDLMTENLNRLNDLVNSMSAKLAGADPNSVVGHIDNTELIGIVEEEINIIGELPCER